MGAGEKERARERVRARKRRTGDVNEDGNGERERVRERGTGDVNGGRGSISNHQQGSSNIHKEGHAGRMPAGPGGKGRIRFEPEIGGKKPSDRPRQPPQKLLGRGDRFRCNPD